MSRAERADFSSLAVMYCPFEIFETCDKELLVVFLLLVGVVGYVLLVGLVVVVEYGFGIVLGSSVVGVVVRVIGGLVGF